MKCYNSANQAPARPAPQELLEETMLHPRRGVLLLAVGALALAACNPTADIPAVVCVGADTTYLDYIEGDLALAEADPIGAPANPGDPADLLAIIQERGEIVVSTDPEYPPQSSVTPEGGYEGFDIDVANEIADRLGVDIRYETPGWDAITAGSWSSRWDISVGSMTITADRKPILSFTQPYYYTPAQMAIATSAGVTDFAALPGELTATTLPTDVNCVEAIRAGRPDFVLWMSSSTTVQGAIDAGHPVVAIGDPLFAEPLAVAIDKSGPPHAELLYEIDQIIADMHADGTLAALSDTWFGLDLTQGVAAE